MGLFFALLVLGGLFWLLWRFRLRRAATLAEWRQLAWPAAVIALFSSGVGLLALAELGRCRRLARATPLVRFDQLPERQAEVVVAGRVSPTQARVRGDWVAYVESPSDGEGASWRETPTLSVELADRSLPVEGDDCVPVGWRRAQEGSSDFVYLLRGDPVVVVGRVVRFVPLSGPERGVPSRAVEAKLVLVGTGPELAAMMRRAALAPGILTALALLGGVLVAGSTGAVGLRVWRRTRRAPC